jgi:hypothetical protein
MGRPATFQFTLPLPGAQTCHWPDTLLAFCPSHFYTGGDQTRGISQRESSV